MYLYVLAMLSGFLLQRVEGAHIDLNEGKPDPVRYKIGREIGSGQHAIVFEAYYMVQEDKIEVAVKIPRNHDGEQDIQNAFRIHKHLGAVNSPDSDKEKLLKAMNAGVSTVRGIGNIVSYELNEYKYLGDLTGQPVLVMDLQGEALLEVILDKESGKRKQIDIATFLNMSEQTLIPIFFLHANGVIHGDIKPENYVYLRDKTRLVLIDLGGARLVSEKFTTITGSAYYYSLRTTILQLEIFKWIPQNYTPLNQDMDRADDLESYAVSVFHIKIPANWTNNVALFLDYYDVALKLQQIDTLRPIQREPAKIETFKTLNTIQKTFWNLAPYHRMTNLKNTLIGARDQKVKFPEDIPVEIEKANLPVELGEILKQIVLYARRTLPGYEGLSVQAEIQDVESQTLEKLKLVPGYDSSASVYVS